MATHFTYDASLMESTDAGYYSGVTVGQRNQVRMWIQDTNVNRQLFQDEEVDWSLKTEANVYTAAAALCDILVTQAGGGGVKSKKIGELAITYDVQFYVTRGTMLRSRGCGHQIPYAGGISASDKATQQADTDWVQPSTMRKLGENPAAPSPSIPSNNPLTTI